MSGNVYKQGVDELVHLVIQTSSSTSPLLLYLLFNLYMPHPTPSPPSLHHIYPETQLKSFLHASPALHSHLPSCFTSSSSPEPRCVHILSSVDSPCNPSARLYTLSSAILPLSLAKICPKLFLPTCTHLDLHPLPINLCNTSGFDILFPSDSNSFLTSLHAQSFNI